MKKLIPFFMAGIFLLTVATAAFAVPTVSSTNPTNGATGVAITTVITIVFSEDMDQTTIDDNNIELLKGGSPVSGTVTYDAATRTATFTPTNPLVTSTTYKGKVKKYVKDIYGVQMASRYEWTFDTAAATSGDTTHPTVTYTDPVNGATNVPINSAITATFSEPMDSATITSSHFTLNGGATGAVTYIAASNEAVFTPSANLASNTTYTATITTGVKDLAGNAMSNTKTWSFTTTSTDTTPPTVISTSPLSGATGIAISSTVAATFSEAMDAATITSATFTLSGGVTGTVAYDAATHVATFTPSSALANSTTYTATITTGVTDLAGNAMTAAKTWSFTTVAAAGQAPLTDYCQQPAFVASGANTLMPNVLLMIDNSGSMNEFAYKESIDADNWYYGYDLAKEYYGYFDSSKMYKYNSTSGGFFEIDTTKTLDKADFWSGNFLNWLTMRRVDVVRKVLVGGKTQPRSASTANYLIGMESPDRDTYKKYSSEKYVVDNGQITVQTTGTTYNIKVYVGNNPPDEGLIIKMSDRIRFGIMFFNGGYRFEYGMNSTRDGGNVAVDLGSTGTNLITQVENTDPTTWTPLAEALYETTRYFQAGSSAYNGGTYSGKDPIQYKCQKNFVLILTDGESTMDRNIPGTAFSGSNLVTDPNGFDVKTYMDRIATNEGVSSQWNATPNSSYGSYYLEGVAYYAHITDFRSSTVGKSDIPGKQNLTLYTVFAFDNSTTARDLLQKTSKYGGFEDKNGNDIPDLSSEWVKKGSTTVPATYFEAQDGGQVGPALQSALDDILARVSSGTAASILSNSEGSGANVLQAVFYPKKYFVESTEASWVGEMQNLWYYIDPFIDRSTVREDTDYTSGDHILNLKKDYVADFYFDTDQTLVKLSEDTDGNGTGDVDRGSASPDDVKSIWRAGLNLWGKTASSRTIFTTINGTSLLVNNFGTVNRTTLAPYLQAANDTEAENIIDYVRGIDQTAYRSRTVKAVTGSAASVWKLGDIVASTPRLQSSIKLNDYDSKPSKGYGDTTYENFTKTNNYKNRGMVYVGANDGMLHAFKLGKLDVTAKDDQKATLSGTNLGGEEWAYIPRNALPYLKYLADPNYKHLYYVDATSTLIDASIGIPTGCSGNYWGCAKPNDGSSWRTILIGGMGLGGASRIKGDTCTDCVKTPILDPADNTKGLGYSSYFALDVTNQYFDSTTGVRAGDPTLLWEFSDPDLGYATAGPAIVRVSSKNSGSTVNDNNGRWFAVFASGPTGPIDGNSCQFLGKSDKNLKLFIVDLKNGPTTGNIWTIDTGITEAFAGAITGGVIDTDRWDKDSPGNYQDDAVYIGYVKKNTADNTWTDGGVLRLMITHGYDPDNAPSSSTWKLSTVINGIGPVTTNIVKLQDRKNHNLWLYFGTGRYYYSQDDNSGQRRLFAVKEKCYKDIATHDNGFSTREDIDDHTNYASCTGTPLVLANLDNRTTVSDSAVTNGWYINLDAEDTVNSFGAERVITDPVALPNGAVYFTTFKPTTDVCSFGGLSYLWALKYDTGSQVPQNALKGKALVQVSTGSFEEIDLKNAFTAMDGRKMGTPMVGKPPSDPPPIISNSTLKPVKKILHVQER